ncbi:hypothetical protein O181_029160 [Austropuccinia psidii MF-1]|uniref:Uncharacterized protein n=1 Tax=Austropuccinia psidii MF-1 TaxID=1389203 RepID=A0A9Q3H4X8_9BASI|nr:hypothetical protein [Austropuccinia psidii MF-1]
MLTPSCGLVAALLLLPSGFAVLSGFDPKNLPTRSDPSGGQIGYNKCETKARPDSLCQNIFIYSAEDFCFFAPPEPKSVGDAERECVSYCSQDGRGTRLIPPGTFRNLHYVRTPHYVQITGLGDFTKVNVPSGDTGGELDPSGADGHGNPIGGLAFGEKGQFNHWTEFLAHDEFCIRACFNLPGAERYCQHIYDLMGCRWNMPGDYDSDGFDQCEGEDVPLPMGEYRRANGSIYTWHQGEIPTPEPGAPGKLNSCKLVRAPGTSYSPSRRSLQAIPYWSLFKLSFALCWHETNITLMNWCEWSVTYTPNTYIITLEPKTHSKAEYDSAIQLWDMPNPQNDSAIQLWDMPNPQAISLEYRGGTQRSNY